MGRRGWHAGGSRGRGCGGWGGFGAWSGFTGWSSGRGEARRPRWLDEDDVRVLLLSILEEGPRTGHDLILEVEERSNGAYVADAQLVYPLLQMLSDQDRLRQTHQDGGNLYELTDAGREELSRERDRVRRLWAHARRRGRGHGWSWGVGGAPDGLTDTMEDVAEAVEDAMDDAMRACSSALSAVDEALEGLGFGCCAGGSRRRGRRPGRGSRGPRAARESREPAGPPGAPDAPQGSAG